MLLRLVALFCAILTMPLVGSQSVTLEDIVDLGSGQVLSQFLTLHDLHELCTTNKAYQKIVQKYLNVPYKHPLAIEVPEFNPRWGFSDNPHFSRTLALSSPQIKEKALLQMIHGLFTLKPANTEIALMQRLVPFQNRIALAMTMAQLSRAKNFRDHILAKNEAKKNIINLFITFFFFDLVAYTSCIDCAEEIAVEHTKHTTNSKEVSDALKSMIFDLNLDPRKGGDFVYLDILEHFSNFLGFDELAECFIADMKPIITVYMQALCPRDCSASQIAERSLALGRILGLMWILEKGDMVRQSIFGRIRDNSEIIEASKFDLIVLLQWLDNIYPRLGRGELVSMIFQVYPLKLVEKILNE